MEENLAASLLLALNLSFGSVPHLGLANAPIVEEQDKSSDIEQQPPFGDRKISNIQPQNRGGSTKPTGTSYNFDKV